MKKICEICKTVFEGPGRVSTCSNECKAVLREQQAERKRQYNRDYKKRTAEQQKKYQKAYYKKTKGTRKISPESVKKNRIAARERYHKNKEKKSNK